MKKLKLFLFTLVAFFVVGFAVNVNALEVTEDLTLSENVTTGIHVPSGANVTLDLNGYSVTGTEATTETSVSNHATIVNEGTLIIKGQGTVVAAEGKYAVLNRDGNLTINNGSYSKENGDSNASLIVNGWYNGTENDDESYSEMLITGGSFDGGSYTAVKNDSYGKITIDGGAFTSTIVKGGIQDAGSSLTINGGTFDLPVLVDTLASKDGEVKSLRVNGGTFNGVFSVVPFNVSSTSETVTLASEIDVYITGMAKFNKEVSLINTNAPEGTLPVQIKQLDVKEFGASLKIYGSASTQYPNLVLDGITVGNLLDLSRLEGAVVKNTTAKKIYAGNAEFINVKAGEYTSKGTNVSTTLGEGTEITKMPVMYNADTTIIVDGAKIGSVLANGGTPYKNFVVRSGSVDSITATMGNFLIEGGEVGTITISNKSTTKVVTVNILDGAVIGTIDNQRKDVEGSFVITLPEGYQVDEETGNVTMPLSNAVVTLDKESYVYTGSEIKPEVTLVKYGSTELVKDTDYSVISYENNTNVGSAKVIIEGQGKYTGTIEKTFSINPIDLSKAKVTGAVVKVYNGYYQKQTALVVTLDGKKLTLGKDYKLLYSNNKNIGTAKYSITGIGNYSGKIYKTFSIIPKRVTINSVTPATKKLTVKYKAVTGTVKYQVAYKLKTNSTYKTVTKLTKTSYTVSKLTSGKYYNVKVRAYKIVNGKTYYGAWSLVKTVKVK